MTRPLRFQILLFSLAVLSVVVLSAWTVRTAWWEVADLRRRLGEVEVDSFHLADQFETRILTLNDMLLRFDLSGDPEEAAGITEEGRGLAEWLKLKEPLLHTPTEREEFERAERALTRYLADCLELVDQMSKTDEPTSVARSLTLIEEKSADLLERVHTLGAVQRAALHQFVTEAHRSAAWLQRLIALSVLLLLALALSVAFLVYRGMIAPLRGRLVESRAVIERQEKLAALGTLAAGLAHEIRNPLTAIKVRQYGLHRSLQEGSSEQEDAIVIGSEIARLERIVNDFLQFARPAEPEWTLLDAAKLLGEVAALMKPTVDSNRIHLVVEARKPLMIRADAGKIKQVLINLVKNATESIGTDGIVTLCGRTDVKSIGGQSTPVAVLEVRDTGKGISPEIQRRLFDPFFTTKKGGTGLGLATAARIIETHGGILHYQTQVNRGSTFGLALPLAHHEGAVDHHTADRG